MSTTVTAERPVTAKLVGPLADAVKHLRGAIDKGTEIKALRIRNGDELDQARAHKLQWVQDVLELLSKLFDNSSVADYVNDWVGKVFPEYAEFGNFVEQFYEEMDHRLGKLRTVLKRVEAAGEGASTPASSPATPASPNETQTNEPTEPRMPASHKVLFVSHGPKDPSSEAVLQFIQQLSLPVLEADHTNGLIESLEGRNDAGFVVVMNAADQVDGGKALLSENSMFKLGYCAGKLGLKRMCMMHGPSHGSVGDTHGIAYVPVDAGGGWQLHLARQMKRAGLDVDLNRLV